MYRGADDWEELKKKAREDEIRQEEMKALNADYMRILAYAKTFGEDVSFLKERGECDADEVAEWEGMLEEVKEMRKCPTSELDGMEVGALLSRLGPADRAVREKADPLRAKVKAEEAEQRKRKREEEEIKEGGEDEEEDDEDFEVEDED